MINNSYKFPQTRTIHMQEKAMEEVTTVPKTLRDVLIQSRNIFNKTLQSKLPENIWLSICKGGAAYLFPSPCWVQESQPKMMMQDSCWQEPVLHQQDFPSPFGELSTSRSVCSLHAEVCALSQTSL